MTTVLQYLTISMCAICLMAPYTGVSGAKFRDRESISQAEAHDLGIVITKENIRWLDVHGRLGKKGQTVNAIRYSMNLPLLVNGESVEAGDFEVEDGCTIFDQRAEVDTKDDYSAYTKFNMTHVVAMDCVGKVAYWADYGRQPGTMYWIVLEVE